MVDRLAPVERSKGVVWVSVRAQHDPLERHAQLFGRDLAQYRARPLPHLGAAGHDHHVTVAQQPHDGGGDRVGLAIGDTHGEPGARSVRRRAGFPDHLRYPGETLAQVAVDAAGVGPDLLVAAQQMLQAVLQGIQPQRLGDAVHLRFHRPHRLGPADGAHGARRHRVGVDAVAVGTEVGAAIGAVNPEHRPGHHPRPVVGIGAGVEVELDLPRQDGAVALDPGLDPAAGRVAPGGQHGFGNGVFQAHRQPLGLARQRHHQRLDLEIGLAAEGAAHVRHHHLDVGHGEPEQARQLRTDEKGMGRGRPQVYLPALKARRGGVGFHGVVTHHGEMEDVLEDLVRLREAPLHVAQLDVFVVADVRVLPGVREVDVVEVAGAGRALVQHRRAVGQRLIEGGDVGKLLVFDADEGNGLLGRQPVPGGHRGHGLAHVARPFHGQDGTVPQTVAVVGVHVPEVVPGEHGHDPRDSQGRACVDGKDARVGIGAAQDPGIQHARNVQVPRELRFAGDLLDPLDAVVACGRRLPWRASDPSPQP